MGKKGCLMSVDGSQLPSQQRGLGGLTARGRLLSSGEVLGSQRACSPTPGLSWLCAKLDVWFRFRTDGSKKEKKCSDDPPLVAPLPQDVCVSCRQGRGC
ncbi:hypothetical protein MHYP_G00064320 [Metynnis hypsauchen]